MGDCAARLLALLALRERHITRCNVAGTLWPETSDGHAHGSLRSALRRLPGPARRAVDVTAHDLGLAAGVEVDLRESRALAFRLLDPTAPSRAGDLTGAAMRALSADLLPGWYDDWVRPDADGGHGGPGRVAPTTSRPMSGGGRSAREVLWSRRSSAGRGARGVGGLCRPGPGAQG